MKSFILAAVLWIACGFVNWGLTMGSCTHDFPYMKHYSIAGLEALMGPFGMPASVLFSMPDFRWRLRGIPAEERWHIFHKEFPSLDREYFEERYD